MILAEPSDPRHRLGERGERHAERALIDAGCRVLARRYRWAGGEIDLVARQGALLLFVEVKTRRPGSAWRPAGAVDARKRARIVRTARHYLARHGSGEATCRFDVIELWLDGGGARRLRWIPAAFDAG